MLWVARLARPRMVQAHSERAGAAPAARIGGPGEVTVSARSSRFAFALCQPGVERWLKAELQASRPDLHAGFQRPGLVSFKATGAEVGPDESVSAIFARTFAPAHGAARSVDEILAVAERIGARHLWLGPRDQGVPDEVPPARQAAADAHAEALETELRATGRFEAQAPQAGDTILDVITSPDEPAFVGWHSHGPAWPWGPAGRAALKAPWVTPSRAWRKISEGLLWSGAPVRRGQRVLELGASPGGATAVLVERGLQVFAVDPNPMDPALLQHASVRFVQRPMGDLRWEDLPPGGVDWLVCDANIPPAHVIRGLARFLPPLRKRLAGLLLTLKLNDDEVVADLPNQLEHLRELGARDLRATQLPSNRGDVFVYARMGG